MTRRHKPTMIHAARADTQRADSYREQARPVPTPSEPPAPAAWEATREPTPTPQPKPGRGRNVRVVVPNEDGSVVLPPDEARAVKGMFDEALRLSGDPEVKKRLRTAQAQMSQRTTRRHGF